MEEEEEKVRGRAMARALIQIQTFEIPKWR